MTIGSLAMVLERHHADRRGRDMRGKGLTEHLGVADVPAAAFAHSIAHDLLGHRDPGGCLRRSACRAFFNASMHHAVGSIQLNVPVIHGQP